MTDLALHDATALPPRQQGWRHTGHRLTAYFRPDHTHQATVAGPAGRFTTPSHFDRWADLYVRHGL